MENSYQLSVIGYQSSVKEIGSSLIGKVSMVYPVYFFKVNLVKTDNLALKFDLQKCGFYSIIINTPPSNPHALACRM